MGNKMLILIVGGLMALIIGAIAGGFLGLIIGGTFFGWLEFPGYPNLTGYELISYIGAIIGAFLSTPLGIIIALKSVAHKEKKS